MSRKRKLPTPVLVESRMIRRLGSSAVVVIPIRMRVLLGLHAGDIVKLTCDADGIYVEREEEH